MLGMIVIILYVILGFASIESSIVRIFFGVVHVCYAYYTQTKNTFGTADDFKTLIICYPIGILFILGGFLEP